MYRVIAPSTTSRRKLASLSATVRFSGVGELRHTSVTFRDSNNEKLLRKIFKKHGERGYFDEDITVRIGKKLYTWNTLQALVSFNRRNPNLFNLLTPITN